MCNPIAIGAIMAATTAVQIVGEEKRARDQVKFQEAQAKAATKNANQQQSALQTQASQLSSQAAEEAQANMLQEAQQISAVRASAGEAGVTGIGVNRLVGDVAQQYNTNQGIADRNFENQIGQIRSNQEGVQSGLESTLNQARQKVAAPGLLDSALRIGSSFVGGYAGGAGMAAPAAADAASSSGGGLFDSLKGLFDTGMLPGDAAKLKKLKQ